MRKIININDSWKFSKLDEKEIMLEDFNYNNLESVNIPHTWNAIDGANGFDYYKGSCWYRKEFNISESDKKNKVYIEFNAVNSIANVYVNGKYVGNHKGGYSAFRFDITKYIEFGKNNVLSVNVDNTAVEDIYPLMADFTFYGGIYRDVNIIITDEIHFDLMDYGSSGIYITNKDVDNKKALLNIKSKITNDTDKEKKVRLWIDIINKQGNLVNYVAKELVLPKNETMESEVDITVYNPVLWSGIENPYMYTIKASIISFNDTLDEVKVPYGIRYFSVDSNKGFYLNGKALRLKGVSRHQDRKDMGWAITHKEQDEDIELIKEVGANSIRLAHYQHNQYFYDLCDKYGMIVWAEIPFISRISKTDLEGINAKQQMIELIRQNYNHPSIVFWGIQNEIQITGDIPEARKIVKELNALTKKEDKVRLTTMANVFFISDEDEYNYMTDVVGYNKYYGWYTGKTEDLAEWVDKYHKTNPEVKLCISEYGAEGIIEYHNSDPKVKDYSEEYQALYHETVLKLFKERKFLWSTYVWNMFDFGANIRDEGGVKGRNNKGLITYDRKIKKDAFYIYKAYWSDEKFVHITSKRYVDREQEKISIKVYSNCNKITIYVNGNEFETKVCDKVFVFDNILLNDGINEIKAVSYENGVILQDIANFNKVKEKNNSYIVKEKKQGTPVNNWFKIPGVTDK